MFEKSSDLNIAIVAGSAWVLGGFASRNEYKLAARAKGEEEKLGHLERAHTLGVSANIGGAVIVYEALKTYPRFTAGLVLVMFGAAAFVSRASLPNERNEPVPPIANVPQPSAQPSAPSNVSKTGYYVPGLFPENWQAWDETELATSQHAGWGA